MIQNSTDFLLCNLWRVQIPKQRRESVEWRSSYEKSSGSLTTSRLQELIDMTKDTYAKASTIVRYVTL